MKGVVIVYPCFGFHGSVEDSVSSAVWLPDRRIMVSVSNVRGLFVREDTCLEVREQKERPSIHGMEEHGEVVVSTEILKLVDTYVEAEAAYKSAHATLHQGMRTFLGGATALVDESALLRACRQREEEEIAARQAGRVQMQQFRQEVARRNQISPKPWWRRLLDRGKSLLGIRPTE